MRMGGTTLPIMTMPLGCPHTTAICSCGHSIFVANVQMLPRNFLCLEGRLNEKTSEFLATDGKPRPAVSFGKYTAQCP